MVPKYNDTTAVSDSGLVLTLPSDREIEMTRVFDAPRHRVFEAHIQCERLKEWWGPRDYNSFPAKSTSVPAAHGALCSTARMARNTLFEGVPRGRSARTAGADFEFEGMPGYVSLETLTLVELTAGRPSPATRCSIPPRPVTGCSRAVWKPGREKPGTAAECLEGITHAEVSP
jgi:hypothetical protein